MLVEILMSSLDAASHQACVIAAGNTLAEVNTIHPACRWASHPISMPVGSGETGAPVNAVWGLGGGDRAVICNVEFRWRDKAYNGDRISTSPGNSLVGMFLPFLTIFLGQFKS